MLQESLQFFFYFAYKVNCLAQLQGHRTAQHVVKHLRQDPLDLIFWSFFTFLYHGINEMERHLL